MPSTKATDFLSKELLINKETVTFRWLSRELALHVNAAKKELESFHEFSTLNRQAVYATYLLVGEVDSNETMASVNKMGVHNGVVSRRKILLVGERELQEAKSHFLHPPSSHIYSLSPTIPTDVTFLTTVADRTRLMDVAKGREHNQFLGMVVSPDAQVTTNKSIMVKKNSLQFEIGTIMSIPEPASPVNAVKPKPTTATDEKLAVRVNDKSLKRENNTIPERKAGMLDWSKAKPKQAMVTKKTGRAKLAAKPEKEPKFSSSGKLKRTSDAIDPSDSELGRQPSGSRPQLSSPSLPLKQEIISEVKRDTLVSDEEGLSDTQSLHLSNQVKRRILVSDEDEEEMDSSPKPAVELNPIQHFQNHFSEADGEGADALSDGPAIPTIPKVKRKPKKLIPAGRNGLPKRRILKSRKTKNAKGYTVTEDYSSYESISEFEDETATQAVKIQRKEQLEGGDHIITDEKLETRSGVKSGSVQINEEEKNKKRPRNFKNDLNNYFKKK